MTMRDYRAGGKKTLLSVPAIVVPESEEHYNAVVEEHRRLWSSEEVTKPVNPEYETFSTDFEDEPTVRLARPSLW